MQRRRLARRALPFVIGFLLASILSCELFASKVPTVTNVVLAQDVKADTLDPVGVTDGYSSDQPEFHAVIGVSDAPAGTVIKAVWTALDVGSAAPQNTTIDQAEKQAQGTQSVHFAVSPDFGRWPPGSYKLEIYLNGQLDRTLNFQVTAPATYPVKPASLVCPPLPPPSLEPSDIVVSVTMALDVQGENKEPVNATTVFPPSAIFHAVVLVEDAPEDTTVTATWYATDLGELSSCNTKLLKTDVLVDDTRNVDFSLTSKIPWPDGEYRVEISVDGEIVQVVTFQVSSAAPSGTAPTGQR
jgi:hypothetical protein